MFPWQFRRSGAASTVTGHVNYFFDEREVFYTTPNYLTDEEVEESFSRVGVDGLEDDAVERTNQVGKRADEGAGCFSRIFFFWYVPLLRKSLRGRLEEEELGKLMF